MNANEIDVNPPASVSSQVQVFLLTGITGSRIDRHIEWIDTDAAGHQHNSVVMRLVEAAEAQLFRELDLGSYFGMAPRVRHEIDYRAKLYFGQEVSAAVIVERVGTSSMNFAFRVWGHPHENKASVLAAEGRFVTVCVPRGAEGAAPWPASVRQALASASG